MYALVSCLISIFFQASRKDRQKEGIFVSWIQSRLKRGTRKRLVIDYQLDACIDLNCYRGPQSKNIFRIGKDIAIIDETDTFLCGGIESFDRRNRVNIYFGRREEDNYDAIKLGGRSEFSKRRKSDKARTCNRPTRHERIVSLTSDLQAD